ncbi:hypothetical protein FH972_010687 [Carpinus fangiana]|uniref:Uncharacterized protein n=1 Tax=Carpinus fangiana TaxID=176857 RepID=A0A660KQX8_9ROSI|nr:hypothetical protein FH972_010687 [Carpinus fangiana]
MAFGLAANSIIISQNRAFTSFAFSASKLLANRPSHPQSQRICPITITATASSSIAKATLSDFQVQDPNPTSTSTTWSEFARNVSGEWDGYGAEFSKEGMPSELPESVVPEAYREWEVKVFDWQTQCPTLAEPEGQDRLLTYKSIKLLPTVGCEADAATRYSIDERSIGGGEDNNKVSAFAYQASGSYVAVWPIEDLGTHKLLELECCLVNPQDRESRVRIIQVVRVDSEKKMGLQKVRVFREQWYGPFRNGEQLGGCAIRDSGFAATDATEALQVVGVWQGPHAVVSFDPSQNDLLQELVDGGVQKSVRDEFGLILLPKQLWCSIKERTDDETWSEVGWLFDHGRAITSRCIFAAGKLKEAWISRETRAA